jgi:LacI family transcriptional regulator
VNDNDRRRPTVAAVAVAAGVSVKTASLALKGDRAVGSDTTRRVREAADRLGYVRWGRASPVLGVITPILNHPFYSEFHQLMEEVAARRDYVVSLVSTGEHRDELSVIDELDRSRVSGIIMLSPGVTDREIEMRVSVHRPIVTINDTLSARPGLSRLNFDQEIGATQAIEYLIAAGRRRIAYLSGPSSSLSNSARLKTFRSVLAGHDLFDYRLLIEMQGRAPASYEFGFASCKRVLELTERPDAILAFNDLVAVGAMRQIADADLKVPEDIAVIGYDDLEIARFARPRLATVQVPRRAAASTAMETLLSLVENPDADPVDITLPTEFIKRESAGLRQSSRSRRRGDTRNVVVS